MRRFALAALLAVATLPAAAFPDRPINLVIPYSPGSGSDPLARAIGEHALRLLGQPLVVSNRDGGSGVVGMRYLAQSVPDGHTLAMTPMTAVVVQPHLVRNTGTTPENFAPVCGVNENSLGLSVRADSTIRDLAGLLAEGRRRSLSYGSAGPNSLPQLGVWRIQRATGVEFTHIPFRGDPPHLNELLGGRLDFSTHVVASAAELIDSGRLRMIGVFSKQRHPDYPNVPTMREQGVDAEQLSQVGIYAPRNTPGPVLDQLEAMCRTATDDALVRRVAGNNRVVMNFMSRTDFTAMVQSEFESYRVILRALGVEPE